MRNQLMAVLGLAVAVSACGVGEVSIDSAGEEINGAEELASTDQAISCAPLMNTFPVRAEHNIGWDTSCKGACPVSCPDSRANSDWNPAQTHNGIDVFAHYRAPLVAVVSGTVTAAGRPSPTSGKRVRIRDACGWEYFYGHMDEYIVSVGQHVEAGQVVGYMGSTGAASVHLHFNVSPGGQYLKDINPFNLLVSTSPTACQASAPPPPPPAPAPAPAPAPSGNCGALQPGEGLSAGQQRTSCDGRFTLAMQTDGNLVLYMGGTALWHTHTNGKGGAVVWMQGDGNFVLYTANGTPLWHSHTNGLPGAFAAIQNDGNLVVYQGGVARWNSGTSGH